MGIIRVHKQKNFSIISNSALYDTRLTFKAKGVWAYLLSKPDDWQVHVSQLAKAGPDGKTAIYSALKELKKYGYMEHNPIRKDGKISGFEYVINEEPIINEQAEKLHSGNLKVENLNVENPDALLKTDKKVKTDSSKNDDGGKIKTQAGKPEQEKKEPSSSFPKSEKPTFPDKIPSDSTAAINLADSTRNEMNLATPTRAEIILAELTELIPDEMKTKAVIARIKKAINQGVDIDLIRGCILYTNDGSDRKTVKRYCSLLGLAIDGKYGEGYEPQDKAADDAIREKAFLDSRRALPTHILLEDARDNKTTKKKACKASQQVLKERGVEF